MLLSKSTGSLGVVLTELNISDWSSTLHHVISATIFEKKSAAFKIQLFLFTVLQHIDMKLQETAHAGLTIIDFMEKL